MTDGYPYISMYSSQTSEVEFKQISPLLERLCKSISFGGSRPLLDFYHRDPHFCLEIFLEAKVLSFESPWGPRPRRICMVSGPARGRRTIRKDEMMRLLIRLAAWILPTSRVQPQGQPQQQLRKLTMSTDQLKDNDEWYPYDADQELPLSSPQPNSRRPPEQSLHDNNNNDDSSKVAPSLPNSQVIRCAPHLPQEILDIIFKSLAGSVAASCNDLADKCIEHRYLCVSWLFSVSKQHSYFQMRNVISQICTLRNVSRATRSRLDPIIHWDLFKLERSTACLMTRTAECVEREHINEHSAAAIRDTYDAIRHFFRQTLKRRRQDGFLNILHSVEENVLDVAGEEQEKDCM